VTKTLSFFLFFIAGIFFSCNKNACESCRNNPSTRVNKSPIANAGADRVITLPIDSIQLDGSASSDPDGSIISWEWKWIGDFALNISVLSTNSKVTVDSLGRGIYFFELKVIDDKYAASFDTIQVIVNGIDCIISGRTMIYPQHIEIGTLSETRESAVAAIAGNKVLFAGGYSFICGPDWSNVSSVVDIYDVVTGSWTTSRLSVARMGITAVTAGNKIFFAGGNDFSRTYANVDIYDVVTNTWTVTHLPRPETNLSAEVLGDKIFFAGGSTYYVDIYNLSTNAWSTANLSVARTNIAVVATGSKIYFAGGLGTTYAPLKTIDIYDSNTNSWAVSTLQELDGGVSGVSNGDKIFWTQGTRVEILNTTNGQTSFECLAANYNNGILKRNDDIVFTSGILTYGDALNVYNSANGSWSQVRFPKSKTNFGITSSNNKIYIGGGMVEWSAGCQTNKVYMINW
jgi:hypothetical protein